MKAEAQERLLQGILNVAQSRSPYRGMLHAQYGVGVAAGFMANPDPEGMTGEALSDFMDRFRKVVDRGGDVISPHLPTECFSVPNSFHEEWEAFQVGQLVRSTARGFSEGKTGTVTKVEKFNGIYVNIEGRVSVFVPRELIISLSREDA